MKMRYEYVILAIFLINLSSGIYLPDVTAKSFDKEIDPSKTHVLLEFYAPWCGHCKSLAPEFEKLGNTFSKNKDIIIAQIDADKHRKLGTRFGVQGFPTMKWISKGKTFKDAEDVNERTSEALIKFVQDKTGIRAKGLPKEESYVVDITPENFDEIVMNPKTVSMVGFFAPWCGHCKSLKPIWEKLASLYKLENHIHIAAIDADKYKELGEKYEVGGFPTLKLFSLENEIVPYSGARELANLVEFLNEKAGTDIDTDGNSGKKAGVLKDLNDECLKKLKFAQDDAEKENIVKKCNEQITEFGKVNEGDKEKGIYYERMLKKILAQGVEYVQKEKGRLVGILRDSSDSLQEGTKRMFTHRVNVLNEFDEL